MFLLLLFKYLFYLQVDSFVIDQVADIDENEARLQNSKFLLPQEDGEHTVDPETQARLEALLEAAGTFNFLEILSYEKKILQYYLITVFLFVFTLYFVCC